MAYAAEHGPSWFDSTHLWTPPVAAVAPLLNDTNTEPMVLPRIVVEGCPNWRGLPEIVDSRDGRTFGQGEVAYPTRVLGKTNPYVCHIEADDRLDFLAVQNALVQSFGDRSGEGVMTVTPWAAPGGVVWTFSALVTDLQFDPAPVLDGESRITYKWAFTLTLRMSDPLYYTDGVGWL